MILLLGGTSETATIADHLACAGFDVMVSTATDTALDLGPPHPMIQRRCGRLNVDAMERLVRDQAIRAIIDAAHPYAERLRIEARTAADRVPVPYFRYVRPASYMDKSNPAVVSVADHDAAAAIAFSYGKPVLLTTGSNNLKPYCREAAERGLPLIVRVLPERESLEACRLAGIAESLIIPERGPFSREQNRAHIRQFGAGVLVTKESGVEGGFSAKLEAAQEEGCRLVVIRRPPEPTTDAYGDVDTMIAAVKKRLKRIEQRRVAQE